MKTYRTANKFLALLLALVLSLSLAVPASAAGTTGKIEDDVWTINFYVKENQQYVTVTRLEKAYTTSLEGLTVGGASYALSGAEQGTVLEDDFGKVCEATWKVPDYTSGATVAVQEETEGLTIAVDGRETSYSRGQLSACLTTRSYSYQGDKTGSGDHYYGIATAYITIPDLLSFLGVSSYTSISFRPIDWEGNPGYIRTLTADEAGGAVLALKSYQSETQSKVSAARADTLNAFRLIPSADIETGFDSVKWVNYISIATDGSSGSGSAGSGGGSAGSGGGGGVTVAPEAETSGDGEATVEVTAKEISDSLAQAAEDGASSIVIAPEVSDGVSKVTAELPKTSVQSIADKQLALTLDTPVADMTISSQGLAGLASQSGSTVSLSIQQVEDENGRPTGEFRVEAAVGGKAVDTVPGGIDVVIPSGSADPGNVLVLVNADGSQTILRSSVVDDRGNHWANIPGSATVKVIANGKSFLDVPENSTFADAVAFMTARELMTGVTADRFDGNASTTRAMVWTILGRGEGQDLYGAGVFERARIWAQTSGISDGTNPGSSITRQQLATMLWRQAGSPASSYSLESFNDSRMVSDYAQTAIRWCVEHGIMTGRTNGDLDPQGTATRYHVAAMYMRYLNTVR